MLAICSSSNNNKSNYSSSDYSFFVCSKKTMGDYHLPAEAQQQEPSKSTQEPNRRCCAEMTLTQSTNDNNNKTGAEKKDVVRKRNNNKKNVRFGTVDIQQYPVKLGASSIPSCGVPIGIDWNVISRSSETVENYEIHRAPRRSGEALILFSDHRYGILLNQGVKLFDMNQSISDCDQIRNERLQTATHTGGQKWTKGLKLFATIARRTLVGGPPTKQGCRSSSSSSSSSRTQCNTLKWRKTQ